MAFVDVSEQQARRAALSAQSGFGAQLGTQIGKGIGAGLVDRQERKATEKAAKLKKEQKKPQGRLKLLETTAKLRDQGFDVSPQQVEAFSRGEQAMEQDEAERQREAQKSPLLTSLSDEPLGGGDFEQIDPELDVQQQLQILGRQEEKQVSLLGKRTKEFIQKQKTKELKGLKFDLDLKKSLREEREQEKPFLSTKKGQEFVAKAQFKTQQQSEGERKLSAKDVTNVQEGNTIPNTLIDIEKTLGANLDLFGPVAGRIAANNPLNTRAQTLQAQITAAAQQFGRFMEGGVLRKEDELKYKKMFPQLSDTPEVARNKLQIIQRLSNERQSSNIAALERSGFDVSGIKAGFKDIKVPLPQVLTKGESQIDRAALEKKIRERRARRRAR